MYNRRTFATEDGIVVRVLCKVKTLNNVVPFWNIWFDEYNSHNSLQGRNLKRSELTIRSILRVPSTETVLCKNQLF